MTGNADTVLGDGNDTAKYSFKGYQAPAADWGNAPNSLTTKKQTTKFSSILFYPITLEGKNVGAQQMNSLQSLSILSCFQLP